MANLLTGLRLLLTVPFAWSLLNPEVVPGYWLVLLLVVVIASDYFDGKIARATGTQSAIGQLFDHGTDFLFVTTSLAALAWSGFISFLLPLLIVVAFSQYVADSYLWLRQKQLRMSLIGRYNGILYFAPLVLVALSRALASPAVSGWLNTAAILLCQCLVLTTLISIADRALAPLRAGRV